MTKKPSRKKAPHGLTVRLQHSIALSTALEQSFEYLRVSYLHKRATIYIDKKREMRQQKLVF
jgi:hypothetical protein